MNLLILYHLLNDLADEKCRLEASMRRMCGGTRQDDLQQQMHQIEPLLAEVCGEVLVRERLGARSTGIAQEFETHLHRILKAYGALKTVHGAETRRTG